MLWAFTGSANGQTLFIGDGAAQGAAVSDLGGADTANAGNMSYLFPSLAYTNSGGGAVALAVTGVHFWADAVGTLRPFVALYNGGALGAAGSYSILAQGDPIVAVSGQANSVPFMVGGVAPTVSVGAGQTLVAGFHQSAGIVPFAGGGTADFLQIGSIVPPTLPNPPTAGATWDSLARTYAFSIAVEEPDDPQPPTAISLSNDELLPGTPVGSLVGVFNTTDPNPGDNLFVYTLVAGAGDSGNALFSIAGERLETAAALGSVGTGYPLRIRSTDPGGLWLEENLTVTVIAGQAPTAIALSPGVVDAKAPSGSSVGRLSTSDPDPADRHTYALVTGTGDEDNGVFVIDGDELRLATEPPTKGASLSVRVRSTDLGGLAVEAALAVLVIDPAVRINEFMAANGTGLRDGDGDTSDWIEILNAQSLTVDLDGWFLTDNAGDLTKWRFPARVLEGGGFLVVFASGKDRAGDSDAELHTNFSLAAGGEFLALVKPDGQTVASLFSPAFPPQTSDVSYGFGPDGVSLGFLVTPTPGGENDIPTASAVNSVGFSATRGFYTDPIAVALTPALEGSVIRYTTNGSKPTPTAGTIYASPVAINGTTTLRAIAYIPGGSGPASVVATHTYVFAGDVAAQGVLTSAITSHPTWGPQMTASLLALPTVSLVKSGGISLTESETSMELIFPDGSGGFQIDCGVEHFGGHSLGSPKKNMRMTFKRAYGKPRLNFDLFGAGGAKDFDSVILRTGSHDTWFWTHPSGHGGIFLRGRWAFDRQLESGNIAPRGFWAHVYLNGTYHGMHHVMERPDAAFMASYLGGEKEDYEALNAGSPIDGDKSTWNAMKAVLGDYAQLRNFMDVKNYADYMLLQFYGGNDWDWNESQNWASASRKAPAASYKFFAWDSDVIVRTTLNANVVNRGGPENLWATVKTHEPFRRLLADRAQQFFFNDGMLTRDRVLAQFDELAARIELPMIAETARWGGGSYTPATWRNEINKVKADLIDQRTGVVVAQMRAAGVFPSMDAPRFSQRGGNVPAGYALALSLPANAAGGQIYYTLDGSDPAGDTEPPPGVESVLLDQGSAARALIPSVANGGSALGSTWNGGAEPFDDSTWLVGTSGIGFDTALDFRPFIGLNLQAMQSQNASAFARLTFTLTQEQLDAVDGLRLDMKAEDGFVAYLNGVEVASLQKPAPLEWNSTATGATPDATALQFQPHDLSSHRGALRVGTNILAFHILNQSSGSSDLLCLPRLVGIDYPGDGGGEPGSRLYAGPIAMGVSGLVRARVRLGTEWSALDEAFYYVDAFPPTPGELAISEIHYHPHGTDDTEFVELRNLGSRNLILDGLRFAAGIAFTFPPRTVLPPGGHVVVVGDAEAFTNHYLADGSPWHAPGAVVAGAFSGSLSNGGESLLLLDASGNHLLGFPYSDGGKWPGRADGAGSSAELRDPAEAPATQPELDAYLADGGNWQPSSEFHGSPGRAGDGPDNRVVVNEILARPEAPAPATIELHNRSGATVDLGGWFLSDGADGEYRKFILSLGTTLPAGAFLTLGEEDFNAGSSLVDFALDPHRGGNLYLVEADADGALLRFVDRAEYDAAAPGESSGRWPDGSGGFYPLTAQTLGAPNNSAGNSVRVGPLVVTEIMYNPAGNDAGFEYIEILNAGNELENLAHWRLRGEADYNFTAESLAPDGILVIVGFNPSTDETARDAFLAAYPTATAGALRGPWSGGGANLLDNGGATVRLQRPGAPIGLPGAPAFHPALFEDAVSFNDAPPWPTTPDGTGPSLTRVRTDTYGDDPGNWTAAPATPGSHTARGITFEDWATASALGHGPKAERLGDFDDDGTNNLLEFALGSNPTNPDPETLPNANIQPIEVLGQTADYLTLTYRRRRDAIGLAYLVQVSGNTVDWSPATTIVGPPINNGDGTESITVRDTQPLGTAPIRFMRLSVSG